MELSSVLRDDLEEWEGGSTGRGYICTYSRFTVLYSRNEHDIAPSLCDPNGP